MKLPKRGSLLGINTSLKGLFLFILLLAGCDTFESDIAQPTVAVSAEELYALAGAETIIDLKSLIATNFAGSLSVTEQPREGTLHSITDGLLRYAPRKGLARVRDSFEFTVFSSDNRIITQDTIYINIEADSAKLPCNIYPMADYVTGFDDSETKVSVDVLKNDILCGKSVSIEVYQPMSNFIPHHGSAQVSGTTVVYTPGATFAGKDTVIYKVIDTQKPTTVGYGFIYINQDSVCGFTLADDLMRIDTLLRPESYRLDVFANDVLCDSIDAYTVTVITPPSHGTITRVGRGFDYRPDYLRTVESDEFTYAVRQGTLQRTARVQLTFEERATSCLFEAVQDSVDITALSTSLIYVDVLQNDHICDSLKTITITRQPQHGTAFIDSRKKIGYNRVVIKSDSLQYEICNGKICSRATAYIKQN